MEGELFRRKKILT